MRGVINMEKAYSYDELASILGCSRTAIAKKISKDEHNPGVERYKNRYNVVLQNGKKCILIDDEALEIEKNKSRGFKNVSNVSYNTLETHDIIEIEPEKTEKQTDRVIEFTERYIERFTTLQETMYNELRNRDSQILLLTNGEKTKEQEYFKVTALNKELKSKYNVATKVIIGLATLLVMVISSFITFVINNNTVLNDIENVSQPVNNVSEAVTNTEKPAEVQAPQQVKVSNQRKK